MSKKSKKIELSIEMANALQEHKKKMPERENIFIYDWSLDFEQNEDWVLWEMEIADFQKRKKYE